MSQSPDQPPLRILHLTAGSDAGGISRYIHDLGVAMVARGHTVAVAGQRGAWHELFANSPLTWIDCPLKGSPLALWRAARTLRRWLEAHPVDVLHTHYRRPTLVARRLQSNRRPPILYTVHLSDLSLRWPRRLLTDFGDHVHVPASEARRWVVEDAGVPADRVHLVPHGIDPAKFPVVDDAKRRDAREILGLPDDRDGGDALVAAYVGRLDYPKNEQWLLDVALRMPRLHLVYAGDGPNELALRHRIGELGLGSRVHLLGHADPLPAYHASDALLLPSLREGFSFACAEAMAAGIPVLRTRTAGTEELILEGVSGRSVPIDRPQFVASAVEFLSDLSALRRMGAAAAQHVRTKFAFDLQLARTIDLYRTLSCT